VPANAPNAVAIVQDVVDRKLGEKAGRGMAVLRRYDRAPPEPKFDAKLLLGMCLMEPLTASADRAIVTQVTKRGIKWEPNYACKCTECGTEYETSVPACTNRTCKQYTKPIRMLEAPRAELARVEAFMRRPNPLNTFLDVIRKGMVYQPILDRTHWEVVRQKDEDDEAAEPNVTQIWVLPSQRMRVRIDKRTGMPGDPKERFCPVCVRRDPAVAEKALGVDEETCPECEGETYPTAWVMVAPESEDETPVMRYAPGEILSYNTWAKDDDLEGNPPSLSLLNTIQLLVWRRLWMLKTFQHGEAPGQIVGFPKMDNDIVAGMYEKAIARIEEIGDPMGNVDLWLGVEEMPGKLDLMPTLRDMEAVREYDKLVQEVAAAMGVSDLALGKSQPGQLGHPEELLTITLDTMEVYSSQLEEFLNGPYLALWPEVVSWHLVVVRPDLKDEEAFERIRTARLGQILQLDEHGWDVRIVDPRTMEYETSGKRETAAQPGSPPPPRLSGNRSVTKPSLGGER